MPLGMRSLVGFEDPDERTFDPTLRIPPLQYPISFLTSRRPSPLEPEARVDDGVHHPTNKLDTRSKGSGDGKKLGDEDPSQHQQRLSLGKLERSSVASSFAEGARKRQKLDLIQLPKPSALSDTTRHPSFASVPVLLNELNEPPPSAALFPPITTILTNGATPYRSDPILHSPPVELPDRSAHTSSRGFHVSKKEKEGKQKRVYLRGRRPWTTQETNDLLKGVELYGVGKWKSILHDRELKFHPDRTTVDLKDRYRTCRLNEERAHDRHALQSSAAKASNAGSSRSTKSSQPTKEQQSRALHKALAPEPWRQNVAFGPEFNISTPEDFRGQELDARQTKSSPTNAYSDKKYHLPRWTAEEDANLSRGCQKYGFRWTAITKDPEMGLGHRTGPQVRDRFRLKYPRIYQSSDGISLPLLDGIKPADSLRPATDSAPSKSASKVQASHRQEITLLLRESSESPLHTVGRSPQGANIVEINETNHGSSVPPLQSLQNNSGLPQSATLQEATGEEVCLTSAQQVTPPASSTSSDRSRQTSIEVEVDDRRNSNVDDILNSENDRHSRLPPFKFPFDSNDWSGEAVADSVVLPPLLWDYDVTSRPLFDFE